MNEDHGTLEPGGHTTLQVAVLPGHDPLPAGPFHAEIVITSDVGTETVVLDAEIPETIVELGSSVLHGETIGELFVTNKGVLPVTVRLDAHHVQLSEFVVDLLPGESRTLGVALCGNPGLPLSHPPHQWLGEVTAAGLDGTVLDQTEVGFLLPQAAPGAPCAVPNLPQEILAGP